MTATVDTFVAFVDVLADVLDDHDASAGDLARRLHVSRFHLDRIVSSVAGEPPSRFRRRPSLTGRGGPRVRTATVEVAGDPAGGATRWAQARSVPTGPRRGAPRTGPAGHPRPGPAHGIPPIR
jgi:AraC family transcriptional regulator